MTALARQRPCDQCPWRRDVARGAFPVIPGAYAEQAPTHQGHVGLDAPLVACHKTPVARSKACAGWLAVEGHNHLGVRLAIAEGRLPGEALSAGDGWPELVANAAEMVERHPPVPAR